MRSHEPERAVHGGPSRRTEVGGAVALLAVIVATWSMATARYGGPDEPAHVIRAAAVADGDLLGERSRALAPGFRVVAVPARLATGDPICFRRERQVPAGCSAARDARGTVHAGTAAGIYPPPYYAIVGALPRATGHAGATGWYRAAAVLANVVVLAVAVARARPLGTAALPMLVAVPPAAVFLLGVVNPNGLEIALLLVAWVGVARLSEGTVRQLLWISVPAAAAILVRPPAALAALAAAAVVAVLVERWGVRRAAAVAAPLAVAGLLVAGWNAWVGLELDDPRAAVQTSAMSSAWRALRDVPTTLLEAAATLSWAELRMPWPAQVLWWAAIVALAVAAVRAAGRRERISWAVWATALLLGPVAFEILFADRIGFIWQGRYSISVLVGAGALVARQPRAPAIRAAVIAAAVAEIAALWALLRRYTVGTDGSWWFLGARGWDPPVSPAVLLGAHVVLVTGSLAVVVRSWWTTTGSSRRRPR